MCQNVNFIAAKQKLYNGIVNMFVEFEDKFPVVMTDKAISDQVIMPLTNAVWYLSGNMGTIQERAVHMPDVQGIPARYWIHVCMCLTPAHVV